MLHYLYARPGWLEVQLSGILINWTAICFCTTRHLYTGSSCLWKSFVSTRKKISFEHFLGKIRLWSPDDITVDFKTQDLCFLFKKMAQCNLWECIFNFFRYIHRSGSFGSCDQFSNCRESFWDNSTAVYDNLKKLTLFLISQTFTSKLFHYS